MKKSLILFCITLFLCHLTQADDIVVLKDGHGFTGKIKSVKGCTVKLKWNNDRLYIPLDQVEYIAFENPEDKVALDFMVSQQNNNCLLGQQDAEMFHGKYGGHVVLGFFFGPFAMIGTAIAQPYPHRGKHTYALSKNKGLFDNPEYAICYKRKAKGRLIGAEAIGLGAWVVLVLIMSS